LTQDSTDDSKRMWVKVDDRFPEHEKVFAAGAHLGPSSTGRVLAIWLEAMCCTNHHRTDGFLSVERVRAFRHDRQPMKVAAAMAQQVRRRDGTMGPGLLVEVEGGFMVHDYSVHNDRQKFDAISAARSMAGRAGGRRSAEARQANAKQTGKQLLQQNGSKAEANGKQTGNPVSRYPNSQVQEHRAEDVAGCAEPVENADEPNHRLLCAVVKAEWKAFEKSGRQFEDETDLSEHMKEAAARAHVPYTGPAIAAAIRAVAGVNGARLS
jgi:hypothetical protein